MSSELGVERPTSLALTESQVERRVHFSDVERHHHLVTPAAAAAAAVVAARRSTTTSTTTTTISPKKSRPDPDFKPKRKRSMSFSSAGEHRFGNRWRYKRVPVLPYKFLLGGNITDPLNLGSLDKEEATGSAGDASSVSGGNGGGGGGGVSRRSSAVRVIIPPNINDPLNLDASSDNEELHTDALQRQWRRSRRRRKRKRRLSEPVDGNAGHDDVMTIVMEQQRQRQQRGGAGGGCTSLSRAPQVTLKPLTINTDLFSPPLPADSRRESVGVSSQPTTTTLLKPGTTTTTTTTTTATTTITTPTTPTTPTPTTPTTTTTQRPPLKKQRHKSDNKIVSPVIPQAGDRKRHPSHTRHHTDRPHLSQQNLQPPRNYNPKNELFQFGNYNKYYGYRNRDHTPDVRLQYLKREWFEGRDVLDIGCNIGHVSLTVARDFNPKRVVGIDIDKKLVNIAQKNIKHYVRKGDAEETNFPESMRLLYGPLRPPVHPDGVRSFPHNIKFVHGNYVLESDELLETVKPEFDLVLCLSITKWIHLNWGDAGLKRFFRRIFHNLRPGGRLVLEPQAWPSYNKRRKLTKRIFENYKSICLFPDKFNDFLLHEIGFSTSEKLVTPNHSSRGFQRPIIIYTKAGGGSNKPSPLGEGNTTATTTATTTTTTRADAVDDEVFHPDVIGDNKDKRRGKKRQREGSEEEKEKEGSSHKTRQIEEGDSVCVSLIQTRHDPESNVHSSQRNTSEQQVEGPESKHKGQDRDVCTPTHTQNNPENTAAHSDQHTHQHTTSEKQIEEGPEIKNKQEHKGQDRDVCTLTHTQNNPENTAHSDQQTHQHTKQQKEVINVCDSSSSISIKKQDHSTGTCVNPTTTTTTSITTTLPTNAVITKTAHSPSTTTPPQQPSPQESGSPQTTKHVESKTEDVETAATEKRNILKSCVEVKGSMSVVSMPQTTETELVHSKIEAVEMGTQKGDIKSTSVNLKKDDSSVISTPKTTETELVHSETEAVEMCTEKGNIENTHTESKSSTSEERGGLKRKAEKECSDDDDDEECIKRIRLGNTRTRTHTHTHT